VQGGRAGNRFIRESFVPPGEIFRGSMTMILTGTGKVEHRYSGEHSSHQIGAAKTTEQEFVIQAEKKKVLKTFRLINEGSGRSLERGREVSTIGIDLITIGCMKLVALVWVDAVTGRFGPRQRGKSEEQDRMVDAIGADAAAARSWIAYKTRSNPRKTKPLLRANERVCKKLTDELEKKPPIAVDGNSPA